MGGSRLAKSRQVTSWSQEQRAYRFARFLSRTAISLVIAVTLTSSNANAQRADEDSEVPLPPALLTPVEGEQHELDSEDVPRPRKKKRREREREKESRLQDAKQKENVDPRPENSIGKTHRDNVKGGGSEKKAQGSQPKKVKQKQGKALWGELDQASSGTRLQAAFLSSGLACGFTPLLVSFGFCGGICVGCGLSTSYFSTLGLLLPAFLGGCGAATGAFLGGVTAALFGSVLLQEKMEDTWPSFLLGGVASAVFGMGLGTAVGALVSASFDSFGTDSSTLLFWAVPALLVSISAAVGMITGLTVYVLPAQALLADGEILEDAPAVLSQEAAPSSPRAAPSSPQAALGAAAPPLQAAPGSDPLPQSRTSMAMAF